MTVLDALTIAERDRRRHLLAKLGELRVLVECAVADVEMDRAPSVAAIQAKTTAVAEAGEMWAACRYALGSASERRVS